MNMYEQLPFFELKALCANYLAKKEYHPSIAAYVERLNKKLVENNLTDEQVDKKAKSKLRLPHHKVVNKNILNEIKSVVNEAMQNGAGGRKRAYNTLYHAFDAKYNTTVVASAKQYATSQNISIFVIEYVCDIEKRGEELLEVAKEIFS